MDHDAGRSAREQADRHSRGRNGPVIGWVAGGAVLGYTLHPALTVPGIAAGAVIGWALGRGDPEASRRWAAGAAGEEATGRLLDPLAQQGWTVLHDRAVPGSRANLDHLLIGPAGQVAVVDSKRWTARDGAVRLVDGRLRCGPVDRHRSVELLLWEARQVAAVLGVGAAAVIVVHGPPVAGAPLRVGQVVVVGPDLLLPTLWSVPALSVPSSVAQRAAAAFPPYGR